MKCNFTKYDLSIIVINASETYMQLVLIVSKIYIWIEKYWYVYTYKQNKTSFESWLTCFFLICFYRSFDSSKTFKIIKNYLTYNLSNKKVVKI